jgi:hypothetical protein
MSNEENKKQISNRSLSANILIVILSIGLIIWAIRLLQSKFTSINSLDAVVNGVVIDIKTGTGQLRREGRKSP